TAEALITVSGIEPNVIKQHGALNGQVLKWNGSAFVPQPDADSGGDITDVTVSAPLTGGGLVGSGTIELGTVPTTHLGQQGAVAGQVLKWNGSAWVPGNDIDTDTGITALSGDVTANGSGSVAATIRNDTITSQKINSTGIGVNRLLITDPTTGNSINYATCGV